MNPEKKLLNVPVSNSLYQALIAYQKQQNLQELNSAVVEILTQFLQLKEETQPYATVEQLAVLSRKVAYLSEQMATFQQAIANSSIKTANPGASSYLEEDEDEPDEILHDFL
ncbi:MAG: hypothetical protein WA919_01070 [Coleofasciculaceae cyanobacterium]